MYAHLTFFHQGYDLFSELQPLMKQLGGQVRATFYTHLIQVAVKCVTTLGFGQEMFSSCKSS